MLGYFQWKFRGVGRNFSIFDAVMLFACYANASRWFLPSFETDISSALYFFLCILLNELVGTSSLYNKTISLCNLRVFFLQIPTSFLLHEYTRTGYPAWTQERNYTPYYWLFQKSTSSKIYSIYRMNLFSIRDDIYE